MYRKNNRDAWKKPTSKVRAKMGRAGAAIPVPRSRTKAGRYRESRLCLEMPKMPPAPRTPHLLAIHFAVNVKSTFLEGCTASARVLWSPHEVRGLHVIEPPTINRSSSETRLRPHQGHLCDPRSGPPTNVSVSPIRVFPWSCPSQQLCLARYQNLPVRLPGPCLWLPFQ